MVLSSIKLFNYDDILFPSETENIGKPKILVFSAVFLFTTSNPMEN